MGLLTGLVTLPLAPVRGTIWVAERLLDEAERQLRDPRLIERQLDDADEAYERGELTAEQHELVEDELMRRLLPGGGA